MRIARNIDINKFSFAQMTSNNDGKTSASGTMGSLCVAAGVLSFIYGVVDYSFLSHQNEVMSQSLLLIAAGTGLLGLRKWTGKDAGAELAPEDPSEAASQR